MKIFNNNAGYLVKRFLLMAVISLTWVACDDERAVNYGTATTDFEIMDPYLQVVTGFVPFEVGTEKYGIEFNVVNGSDALTSVKMYGTFFDSQSGLFSNEVLYGEYPVEDPNRTVVIDSLSYADLTAGVLVDGSPLPESDEDIFPGSGWAFRFEGDYAAGKTLTLIGEINMVLSKYAGIYVVSNSHYMRIQPDPVIFPPPVVDGVPTYDGEQVFIGFVDESTLSYNDRWGYFAWPGCSFNFSYDEDGVVTEVPILTDCGSFSGTMANCTDNKSGFNNLSAYLGFNVCDVSNVIIDNDVTGEHQIKLTYGYLGGGGYRQFTETLTKVVD